MCVCVFVPNIVYSTSTTASTYRDNIPELQRAMNRVISFQLSASAKSSEGIVCGVWSVLVVRCVHYLLQFIVLLV